MSASFSRRFSARLDRARAEMVRTGVGALLLGPSADFRYLTGYNPPPLERLTLLVVPASEEPVLVVPELERALAEDAGVGEFARIAPWGETADPYALVRVAVHDPRARLAVADRLWATFLLALEQTFPDATFERASTVTRALRIRKDAEEIDALRRAGAAADRVARAIAGEKLSGRTEREVSRWISEALLAEGCERVGFAIVASGPNAASPHHEPGSRALAPADALVCDFGGPVDGYCSDITRTFVIERPPDGFAEAYEALAAAQAAAVAAVRPGAGAESVDAAARSRITDAGYGELFIHRTGHGIGLEEHEDPYIVAGNSTPLEEGMAFSVEPGIYLRGRFGMRIEDIVVVTAGGVERLNLAPRDLVVLG